MTAQITLSCDGTWDEGRMPCRGALPTRTTQPANAELVATESGWSITRSGDYCPACTAKRAQGGPS